MFMRFVNLKVKEGMLRDLARFYEDRVIPALQDSGGCLYASLLQPSDDDRECVSLTFWRSSEAADAYEKSGAYDELLDDSDVFLGCSPHPNSPALSLRCRTPRSRPIRWRWPPLERSSTPWDPNSSLCGLFRRGSKRADSTSSNSDTTRKSNRR